MGGSRIQRSAASPDLAGWVESIWSIELDGDEAGPAEILPDAYVDLLVEVTDARCRLRLFGPTTRVAELRTASRATYVGVRLRPGRAPRLVDAHPRDLIDRTVDLPSLLGASLDELGEAILNRPHESCCEAIEAVLRRAPRQSIGLGDRAVARIAASDGRARVSDVAEALHVTPRSVERAVLERTGLAPKAFGRLLRFQRALAMLSERPRPSLERVAERCGYADASHVVKEFRALVGRPPGAVALPP